MVKEGGLKSLKKVLKCLAQVNDATRPRRDRVQLAPIVGIHFARHKVCLFRRPIDKAKRRKEEHKKAHTNVHVLGVLGGGCVKALSEFQRLLEGI